ncbi:hypothetical protein [Cyclobacterium qasimii]|uniref:DUF1330 domain-containing protein n=2 Tax=Cyclobacterium qasimii TaxID=1350429 RepID=S7VJD0_9BACT|nr:hypothetical protein [Cyclobacterium qasimii]EPR69607.1 hypothetical protein ADICYQ_1392 [Cyclobacterium qasimii M12-11B]GEO21442.1 hypothetical protein CQA01_19760 [Cyclobacterium qasimii]
MDKYLDADPEAGIRFYKDFNDKGKVVMMNLLKFRTVADYTNLESLKSADPITGEQAYELYMDNTMPELNKAGSRILFYGECKHFIIGPDAEKWDAVLLVEHQSVNAFIAFSQNKDFLENAGHRTAALEDSRLLPISENEKYT